MMRERWRMALPIKMARLAETAGENDLQNGKTVLKRNPIHWNHFGIICAMKSQSQKIAKPFPMIPVINP